MNQTKDEEDGKIYALLSRVCRAWVIDRDRDKEHNLFQLRSDAVDCRLLKVSYEQNISTKCAILLR